MNGNTPEQPTSGQAALFQLAIFAAQKLLEHAPALFAKLITALSRESVTVEDLEKERTEIAGQHYKDFVPATQIPPEEQT